MKLPVRNTDEGQPSLVRQRLPAWLSVSVAITVIAGVVVFMDREELLPAKPVISPGAAMLVESRPSAGLVRQLKVGDKLPHWNARGWLNGVPSKLSLANCKLVVVDFWSQWCPVCDEVAPKLLKLHKKYKHQGVAFVSLTNMAKANVASFVSRHRIPWFSGFGVPTSSIAECGAFNSGMPTPGYEVAPTIYLVGPDGRIRWHDQRLRMQHPQPGVFFQKLDSAISDVLEAMSAAES